MRGPSKSWLGTHTWNSLEGVKLGSLGIVSEATEEG